MLQTISITVKGKVQGVYYRASAQQKAREMDITGQIKNLKNSDVYIIATGTETDLKKFTDWCRHGPPHAIVTELMAEPLPLQTFSSFSIVR